MSFNSEQRFIVTGASSGIGEGTAILLNELGATVIGIGRNQERLEKMKAKCKFPENMFLENKDLTEDIENLPQYIKSLKEKYGKFQGMAYCAGITDVTPLQIINYNNMKRIFDIDYYAPIFMAKAFADKRINNGKSSACVFVSSYAALACTRGMSTYSGVKSALIASVTSIARELSPRGIRFNCVSPTDVVTPMTTGSEEAMSFLEKKRDKYPLGFGEVADVANMIAFLLSDKAKWITAQNYIMDSGEGKCT